MPEACMSERVPGGKKARMFSWVSTWFRNRTLPPRSTPRFAVSPVASIRRRRIGAGAVDKAGAAQEAGADDEGMCADEPELFLGVELDKAARFEGDKHAIDRCRGLIELGGEGGKRPALRGAEVFENLHSPVEGLDDVLRRLVVPSPGPTTGAAGFVRGFHRESLKKIVKAIFMI